MKSRLLVGVAMLMILFVFIVPQVHAQPSRPMFLQGYCNNEPCDDQLQDAPPPGGGSDCSLMETRDNQETFYTTDNQNFAQGYIYDSNIDNQNQSACHAGWGEMLLNSNVNMNCSLCGATIWIGSLDTKFYEIGASNYPAGSLLESYMLSHADELRSGCYSAWWSGTVNWSGHNHNFNIKMLSGSGC